MNKQTEKISANKKQAADRPGRRQIDYLSFLMTGTTITVPLNLIISIVVSSL